MTNHYDHRLVSFIDILGFSSMVKKSVEDKEYGNKIFKALKQIQQQVRYNEEKKETENSDFEMVQFSDSLVISQKYINTVSLTTFIMRVNFIQKILADKGILIRGGISAGQLYHEDTIAYGPAFIKAYELESQYAKFPRIILDPKIMTQEILPQNESMDDVKFQLDFYTWEGNRAPIVLKDEDGMFYVNYLYGMYEEPLIAENLRNHIMGELQVLESNNELDSRTIEKLEWILDYIASCPWVQTSRGC